MTIKARSTVINASEVALIGLLAVAPLAILELRNMPASGNFSHFPYPLFILLWLISMAFTIAGAPILRSVRAGDSVLAHPVSLLFRVLFLALFAIAWAGIVRDQMPCFLGVPNCD